jgi:hypothetical protein
MPPNGGIFSLFPPISRPRLRRRNGTFKTEDKVEKVTILSEGYVGRPMGREGLDQRYRKIGISAVAAAVRYQGEAKQAKPANDARHDDQATTESAA